MLVAAFATLLLASLSPPTLAQDASALQARHAALRGRLADNQFGRPLVLESSQSQGDLTGDVYTVIEHPFAVVQQALATKEQWCEILILHLNVKGCIAKHGDKTLLLEVGRKFDQPVSDTYKLPFDFRVATSTAEYLQIRLSCEEGPLGTRDYRIHLEVIPLDANRSFVHMSYAYGYGLPARLAMQTYLATIGRDKVGFTIVDRQGGKPNYLGGVLGLLERNTMRYYLAIEAYLGAYSLPAGQQVEKRIHDWYASTERYARQLHEMDEADYLEMKRKEIRRQRQPRAAAS